MALSRAISLAEPVRMKENEQFPFIISADVFPISLGGSRIEYIAMTTKLIASVVALFTILFGFAGCGEEQPTSLKEVEYSQKPAEIYIPPPAHAKSLVNNIQAHRDGKGRVVVDGKILLPQKTKIVVNIFRGKSRKGKDLVGESKTIVDFQSSFSAGPFDIPKPGEYSVEVSSYFNGPWRQPPEVIAQVGSDGTKLPKAALVPDDPEFPERGGHLDYVTIVTVPPLSPEFQAIEAVKYAKLFVKGKGKAVDSVAEIVQFFNKRGTEFHPGEWTATKIGEVTWKVSLQHRWGSEQKVANWEYNARTGQVKYLDPEGKMLSWIPAE
jgi:hypothetical protein